LRDFLDTFESYRSKRGLKIAEACDAIGISRSLFYAVKDGRTPVSDKAMELLNEAMTDEPNGQKTMTYEPRSMPSAKVSESTGMTRTDVRVMIGEIKVRLDLIQTAFDEMIDN
jgi:hypothetical protein